MTFLGSHRRMEIQDPLIKASLFLWMLWMRKVRFTEAVQPPTVTGLIMAELKLESKIPESQDGALTATACSVPLL